jgi:hypothetical protein
MPVTGERKHHDDFFMGDKSIEIEEVIDRWLALEYRLHLSRFLYAISRI